MTETVLGFRMANSSLLCQYDGAVMGSNDTSERLNYKIAEYSLAVVKDKPHFHISFVMNVSPECDCWNHNDAAIVPDLGILASFDPVSLGRSSTRMHSRPIHKSRLPSSASS